MGWLKRGPNKLEKLRALGLIEDAIGRAELPSFAAQSRHVRTTQGRTAHLDHPVLGILCGWKSAEWTEDPSKPVCRMCEDRAAELSEGRVA